jgi:hypothetical protein
MNKFSCILIAPIDLTTEHTDYLSFLQARRIFMWEFLASSDLWANIVGGVVAALLFALLVFLWNLRKHKILKDLTEIMGRAIVHRNIGEKRAYTDKGIWIQQAKDIENEAIEKAKKLSSTAGALVEWLDRVPPWTGDDEVERYVSILSKVIERIRELMERNT